MKLEDKETRSENKPIYNGLIYLQKVVVRINDFDFEIPQVPERETAKKKGKRTSNLKILAIRSTLLMIRISTMLNLAIQKQITKFSSPILVLPQFSP